MLCFNLFKYFKISLEIFFLSMYYLEGLLNPQIILLLLALFLVLISSSIHWYMRTYFVCFLAY